MRVRQSAGKTVLAALIVWFLSGVSTADDATPALSDAEQAFVKQLAGKVMVGTFTVEGRGDRTPKEERYEIGEIKKLDGDVWTVEARIKYGKVDAAVPVPVRVLWAGDTPMISVTDLTIPLVGSEFSARVLIHDGLYAGTWRHGKVGGHMWGRIEEKPAAGN